MSAKFLKCFSRTFGAMNEEQLFEDFENKNLAFLQVFQGIWGLKLFFFFWFFKNLGALYFFLGTFGF